MSTWSQTTKQMYTGVLVYSLCGVAKSIVDPITGAAKLAKSFSGASASAGPGVLSILLSIAIICGYVYFFLGLKEFRNVVNENDAPAVKNVYTATILSIVAYVCGCIPFLGLVGKIVALVSFILMLMGFNALKKSATFPALACKGASMLFTAMILSIVGVVLGWIPLIGGILGAIINVVGFILTILGWGKISKAEA